MTLLETLDLCAGKLAIIGLRCCVSFCLCQVQFLNLVNSGDHNGALRVACSHLGPLAAKDPPLLKLLKETLLALIRPAGEVLLRSLPLVALSSSLQV